MHPFPPPEDSSTSHHVRLGLKILGTLVAISFLVVALMTRTDFTHNFEHDPVPQEAIQAISATQPVKEIRNDDRLSDKFKIQPIANGGRGWFDAEKDALGIKRIKPIEVPPKDKAVADAPQSPASAIEETPEIQVIADTPKVQVISDTKLVRTGKFARSTIQTLRLHRRLTPSLKYSRSESTIFISMPSYRDNECWKTIVDAYARAAHPERIFFGVFQQHGPYEKDCFEFANVLRCFDNTQPRHPLCGRFEQVRIHRVHFNKSRGLPYARYQAEQLYKKETFVFQIDAHSRFVQNWDTTAIDMFNTLGNEFGVLSSYPKPTDKSRSIPKKYNRTEAVGICESEVKKSRPLCKVIKPKGGVYIQLANDEPVISPYIAGGLCFSRGHRIESVPSDPHLKYVFEGEEIAMAVRLWTHGYDVYTPNRDLIFHVYGSMMGVNRKVFWKDDYHDGKKLATRLSYWRLHVMMGTLDILLPGVADSVMMEAVDLDEMERFGVGKKRNKNGFWDWAMIDLKRQSSKNICGELMNGGLKRIPVM